MEARRQRLLSAVEIIAVVSSCQPVRAVPLESVAVTDTWFGGTEGGSGSVSGSARGACGRDGDRCDLLLDGHRGMLVRLERQELEPHARFLRPRGRDRRDPGPED